MPFAECRLAVPEDDADLRRLLRENPIKGAISLSFEREPNYFLAANIEGPFHQTMLVCEQKTKKIMGMGNRSVRPMWVNGRVQDIGYFSGLRADSRYKEGLALARFAQQGFAYLKQLDLDGRCPFYLVSIIADNRPARRLLTAGLNNIPKMQEYARLFTYALHISKLIREIPLPKPLTLQRGSTKLIPAIVECLNRNHAKKNFAPHWTDETLISSLTPKLAVEDFFLAMDGEQVVGCLALWNQSEIKQTVVRGYSGFLYYIQILLQKLNRFGKFINLPNPGQRLNQCFISFVAINDDNPAVFKSLLRAAYNEAHQRKLDFLLVGFSETNPLRNCLTSYRVIQYSSQIYLASWQNPSEQMAALGHHIPAFEIATM